MLVIVALAALTASLVLAASASADGFHSTVLATQLSGEEEVDGNGVPGQGDPDGRGAAVIKIDTDTDRICWAIVVHGIELPAIAAHIHQAPAGVNGSIVVHFSPPTASNRILERLGIGVSHGCTTNPIADAIVADPSGFYVNVHNTPFPAGAVRGQL
jgi:hypothetical protein